MDVTINNVAMSYEDKESLKQQILNLIKVYKKQTSLTRDQIKHFFGEWKAIATRISVGGAMLDNIHPIRDESKLHTEETYKLYLFLLKVLGLYDLFFEKMFADNPEYLRRAKLEILSTTQGN